MTTQFTTSKVPTLASDQLKPSKAGYGQGGYGGASSDVPGENTTSGFLPSDDVLDTVKRFGTAAMRAPEVGDDVEDVKGTPATQLCDISKNALPTTFGMKNPNANNPTIGQETRPVKARN